MARAPIPDPDAAPVPADELAGEGQVPDDGPLIDTGPAEIDIEREGAGNADRPSPDLAPDPAPEIQTPPD